MSARTRTRSTCRRMFVMLTRRPAWLRTSGPVVRPLRARSTVAMTWGGSSACRTLSPLPRISVGFGGLDEPAGFGVVHGRHDRVVLRRCLDPDGRVGGQDLFLDEPVVEGLDGGEASSAGVVCELLVFECAHVGADDTAVGVEEVDTSDGEELEPAAEVVGVGLAGLGGPEPSDEAACEALVGGPVGIVVVAGDEEGLSVSVRHVGTSRGVVHAPGSSQLRRGTLMGGSCG